MNWLICIQKLNLSRYETLIEKFRSCGASFLRKNRKAAQVLPRPRRSLIVPHETMLVIIFLRKTSATSKPSHSLYVKKLVKKKEEKKSHSLYVKNLPSSFPGIWSATSRASWGSTCALTGSSSISPWRNVTTPSRSTVPLVRSSVSYCCLNSNSPKVSFYCVAPTNAPFLELPSSSGYFLTIPDSLHKFNKIYDEYD